MKIENQWKREEKKMSGCHPAIENRNEEMKMKMTNVEMAIEVMANE